MLVRDPARRCSLATVRKHSWMRVEVPQKILELEASKRAQKAANPDRNLCLDNSTSDYNNDNPHSKGQQPLNEQVLRVMQSLGIDPARTSEVLLCIYIYQYQ